ncbi:MAG: glycosyltransferase family 2 protein [Anaerolineae bacterium]|nr:glycosyltransferase family 2 protein [Anaerolineae bacterium]
MDRQVDLIWMGESAPPPWPLGEVRRVSSEPDGLCNFMVGALESTAASAWLFWDSALGNPDPGTIEKVLSLPGDVWHAGLLLGMDRKPALFDFVSPTWMLNRDPDPLIEATSWRLSLRACLLPVEVVRQMGFLRVGFETLEGAALEMGHRYIRRGVLVRHIPWLIDWPPVEEPMSLPIEEQLWFIYYRARRMWSRWALMRAILSGTVNPFDAVGAWREVCRSVRSADPPPYVDPAREIITTGDQPPRVSIIIPTIDRYPYLRTLLDQLRGQTIQPQEIIVIDQTPKDRRDMTLEADFADLPLRLLTLEQAGQCSSRNAGLQSASGDYILFIDDDDEVPLDLIEGHLENMRRFDTPVSCGTAHEVSAGPLPEDFTYIRASDIFPTNNALIRREVLRGSGLFDLAYERGARADGDIGMRIYLSGQLMVYNPEISVLHHHAPRGGLRTHKARAITYGSSRNSLTARHLPAVTEIYLAYRYFMPRQVREMLWLRIFGTFSIRGGWGRKLLKALISLCLLPDTLWRIHLRHRKARLMLRDYPQIPRLEE